MAKETELNYRFKAYQIESEDHDFEWGVEFIDVPNIVGGGDTVEEAYYEALENLHVYFDYLKDNGEPIPEPTKEPSSTFYSGKLVLRLSKNNHKLISEIAEQENVSINALLNEMISEGITNKIANKATSELISDLKEEYIKENNLSLKLAKN